MLAGAALSVIAQITTMPPKDPEKEFPPLTFRAYYDDHWEFCTHELVFLSEPLVAELDEL